MKIQNGFNNKETEINIYQENDNIILLINQTGLKGLRQETLSYLTYLELVELKREVNKVLCDDDY